MNPKPFSEGRTTVATGHQRDQQWGRYTNLWRLVRSVVYSELSLVCSYSRSLSVEELDASVIIRILSCRVLWLCQHPNGQQWFNAYVLRSAFESSAASVDGSKAVLFKRCGSCVQRLHMQSVNTDQHGECAKGRAARPSTSLFATNEQHGSAANWGRLESTNRWDQRFSETLDN
jgi:hypothetical protein